MLYILQMYLADCVVYNIKIIILIVPQHSGIEMGN